MTSRRRPHVIIVGGGFAGLQTARMLARAPVEVTLVDRRNHHLFQPLLYQVATASLSPADISVSIRSVLRKQANCRVALAKVVGVDVERRHLIFERGRVRYDFLVLAAGATHSYFGNDHWADIAPGLKTLEDATELRRRLLLAFESAEYEGNDEARRAALTFAIVGGGPTGVELAGAIKEIAGRTIPADYRHIDTRTTRVILFQGEDRVLPAFPPQLSEQARRDLEQLGVEVRLNALVTNITPEGVHVGKEFVPARNTFWAAGVRGNSLGQSLGVPLDQMGRVIVNADLTIPGRPEVFVIGDLAAVAHGETGELVPGVAQGAIQMGRHVGRMLADETSGRTNPSQRRPFRYRDKGTMAVIGKARAVAAVGGWRMSGLTGWLLWAVIHLFFLIGFRNRLQVMGHWFWNWLINARDARLITGDATIAIDTIRPDEFVVEEDDT